MNQDQSNQTNNKLIDALKLLADEKNSKKEKKNFRKNVCLKINAVIIRVFLYWTNL